MRFLDYAPILHISALTGERTDACSRPSTRSPRRGGKRVPTPALNKFIESVTAANPPVSPGRKHVRIMYAAQIGVAPPSFVFFTNVATTFHFSYERFLINQLRERVRLRRDADPHPGAPPRSQHATSAANARRAACGRIRRRAAEREVQKERKDRRARKNRRDLKER